MIISVPLLRQYDIIVCVEILGLKGLIDMSEVVYRVCGKGLADRITDRHTQDLYEGKNGDLFSLDIVDPDRVVLRGNREVLNEAVAKLATNYAKNIVTVYEIEGDNVGNVMSIGPNGSESTKDWLGWDMPGVNTYRLWGRELGDWIRTEFCLANSRRGDVHFDVDDLNKGLDFMFAGAKHPVNIEFESFNTLIMRAYPEDVDTVTKYLAKTGEISISRDQLHQTENSRVSFDASGKESQEDWLGRPERRRRVPAYDNSLDGVYERIEKDKNRVRDLPCGGEFDDNGENVVQATNDEPSVL